MLNVSTNPVREGGESQSHGLNQFNVNLCVWNIRLPGTEFTSQVMAASMH